MVEGGNFSSPQYCRCYLSIMMDSMITSRARDVSSRYDVTWYASALAGSRGSWSLSLRIFPLRKGYYLQISLGLTAKRQPPLETVILILYPLLVAYSNVRGSWKI